MAAPKSIVLITGANGGIGFELASQLLRDPKTHVLLGSRSTEKGEAAVKDLQSQGLSGTVGLLKIDVDSEDSISSAAEQVQSTHGRIDALVNNAAIGTPSGTIAQQLNQCFRTNVTGSWLTVQHFAPLLRNSITTPRIINISSGAGSIGRVLDPTSPMYKQGHIQYRASKAALNMVTAVQSVEYGDQLEWKVFAFCPGFTVSNLSSRNKAENGAKPTSEGAEPIVRILKGERDAEAGKFLNATGQYPW